MGGCIRIGLGLSDGSDAETRMCVNLSMYSVCSGPVGLVMEAQTCSVFPERTTVTHLTGWNAGSSET